jgi:hypothetical protein
MGMLNPTLSMVIMTPAPPAPTKPSSIPNKSMAAKTSMDHLRNVTA